MNIIIMIVDQLRADVAYHERYPFVQTPNLDQLRSDGITCQQAFCQYPVCGPSRASLLTGRYPQQNRVLNIRCLPPESARTIGHHFSDLGYEVVAIGKTHGQNRGFRRYPEPTSLEKTLGSNLWGFYYGQDMLGAAGYDRQASDPVLGVYPGEKSDHYDQRINQQVEAFLSQRSEDRPFLLWIGYHAPHPPLFPPRHVADLYSPEQIDIMSATPVSEKPEIQARISKLWRETPVDVRQQMIAAYLALITFVDECIGDLVQILGEQSVLDDTLLVITSDHGEQMGDHGMIGKFNNFYEGSLRIPLLLRLPGGRHKGLKLDQLVELVDVFPTLCALTGAAIPQTISGRSLAPMLEDPQREHRPYANCMLVEKDWHGADAVGSSKPFVHGQMVRTRRWKLAVYTGDRGELYDLEADPQELNNLYDDGAHAAVRAELYQQMLEHLLTNGAEPANWGLNLFPG